MYSCFNCVCLSTSSLNLSASVWLSHGNLLALGAALYWQRYNESILIVTPIRLHKMPFANALFRGARSLSFLLLDLPKSYEIRI